MCAKSTYYWDIDLLYAQSPGTNCELDSREDQGYQ